MAFCRHENDNRTADEMKPMVRLSVLSVLSTDLSQAPAWQKRFILILII